LAESGIIVVLDNWLKGVGDPYPTGTAFEKKKSAGTILQV